MISDNTVALDLGCGQTPRNKFGAAKLYGIDIREDLASNILKADLATDAIPFPESYFDFVTAFDLIEHIPRVIYIPERRNPFVELMNEIYRVLKPGGLFFSSTPAYPHSAAFQDPTHVNIITADTFPLYFDNKTKWASMYGFSGAFEIHTQVWNGSHLETAMKKSCEFS